MRKLFRLRFHRSCAGRDRSDFRLGQHHRRRPNDDGGVVPARSSANWNGGTVVAPQHLPPVLVTGIDSLDALHERAVGALAEVQRCCFLGRQDEATARAARMIGALSALFRAEEAAMAESGYAAAAHLAEHGRIEALARAAGAALDGRATVARAQDTLPECEVLVAALVRHMEVDDARLAAHLRRTLTCPNVQPGGAWRSAETSAVECHGGGAVRAVGGPVPVRLEAQPDGIEPVTVVRAVGL
jgi:hemerythrin